MIGGASSNAAGDFLGWDMAPEIDEARCARCGRSHSQGLGCGYLEGEARGPLPLFVCHANCSRSMLAAYLYRHLTGCNVMSAGLQAGSLPAPRTLALLRHWGVDASRHRATQLDRSLCDRAAAIFTMGPLYTRRLLIDYGEDLAVKTYLFADPFTRPVHLTSGEYLVADPGFDERCDSQLEQALPDYAWFRERVLAIHTALAGGSSRPLIPASKYMDVLAEVAPL
jgi:hypothetical protein